MSTIDREALKNQLERWSRGDIDERDIHEWAEAIWDQEQWPEYRDGIPDLFLLRFSCSSTCIFDRYAIVAQADKAAALRRTMQHLTEPQTASNVVPMPKASPKSTPRRPANRYKSDTVGVAAAAADPA